MRTSWVTTLFNETAVAVDASAMSSQVLLDEADWRGAVNSLTQLARIKRIVYNGVCIPVSGGETAFATDAVSWIWAVYVIDSDNPTTQINTTAAGGTLQGERILQTGIDGMLRIADTEANTISESVRGFPINLDLRVALPLRPDHELRISLQLQSDASSVLSAFAWSGFSRVLIEQP